MPTNRGCVETLYFFRFSFHVYMVTTLVLWLSLGIKNTWSEKDHDWAETGDLPTSL